MSTRMRQAEYWNDYAGDSWAARAERLDAVARPLGGPGVAATAVRAGERVLDIGCGTGGTTLELAAAAGSGGRVVGVDVSAPMIAAARRRVGATEGVEFLVADVEEGLPFDGFDAAHSRQCLMLLDDPVRGVAAIRAALRPGGRLVATTFRSMADNPWLPAVVLGAAPHVDPMPPLPLPGEPGPFAFADSKYAASVLHDAGFADISVTPFDPVVRLPGPAEAHAELLIALGPAGGVYDRADAPARAAARAGVATQLARFTGPDGALTLPGGMWLITARNPETGDR